MAEEAKDAGVTIPAAVSRVRIAVFAIYFTLPAVALSALPVQQRPDGSYFTSLGESEDRGGFAGDPVLGVVRQLDLGVLQGAGQVYVGLLAATILFIATNAGIVAVSRLVYSMGMHRQVPDRLRRLHPRHRTPWIGILVFGGVAALALLPGEARFLANLYAFGAMLSFTIAHLSVIVLRVKAPDAPRPYRGPGNLRLRGRDLPLFAVLGGVATGLAFIVVTALHPEVAVAGTLWLGAGIVLYVLFRRRAGLGYTTTHKVAIPAPVVDHEAEYDSVLVYVPDGGFDPEVLATAFRLAARRRRGVHVLVTVTVPNALPIGAAMPEQEAAAQSVIEQARMQGGRRVSGHVERVRAGQAGRRIVEEATDMRAAAVVMPLPRRVEGSSLFGKTLETVLAERPCRVIIESSPAPRNDARRP
jgi:APA family basic amino acid/polyamine antiporter